MRSIYICISQELELSNRVQIDDNGSLIIEEVGWSDLGVYTCTDPGTRVTRDTFLYPLTPNMVG